MSNPSISWFKTGIVWNVNFTATNQFNNKVKNITAIIEYEGDRKEAVRVAVDEISKYGYTNITIDHIVKVR